MSVPEAIISAFGEVPYPGDDSIALHECPGCRQIRDDLRGMSSRAIADAILECHYGDLPLLSPAAFHCFVPAYMLYSLQHPDSEVAYFTLLGLGKEERLDAFNLERFRLFNRQQREAVIVFLEFFKSHEIEGDDQDNREYQEAIGAAIRIWTGLS